MNKTIAYIELAVMFVAFYLAAKTGEMNFFYFGCFVFGSHLYDVHGVK